MKKAIIILTTVLALTSTSVLAAGSKRPGVKWPPAIDLVVEVTDESQS